MTQTLKELNIWTLTQLGENSNTSLWLTREAAMREAQADENLTHEYKPANTLQWTSQTGGDWAWQADSVDEETVYLVYKSIARA